MKRTPSYESLLEASEHSDNTITRLRRERDEALQDSHHLRIKLSEAEDQVETLLEEYGESMDLNISLQEELVKNKEKNDFDLKRFQKYLWYCQKAVSHLSEENQKLREERSMIKGVEMACHAMSPNRKRKASQSTPQKKVKFENITGTRRSYRLISRDL